MSTSVSDFTLQHEKYSTSRSNSGGKAGVFSGIFSCGSIAEISRKFLIGRFVSHQRQVAVGNTVWVWVQANLGGAEGQEMARVSLATGTKVGTALHHAHHGTCSWDRHLKSS